MRAARLGESPLIVAGVLTGLALAWSFGIGERGARAERGAAAPSETADEASARPRVEGLEPPAPRVLPALVRHGPRLLRDPDPSRPGLDISVEDADGHSMDALHAALRRAGRGEGQARLVFYGASHVASDFFTGALRKSLQARFGDAGHGVILPAHPWRTYRHLGVRLESDRRRWHGHKVVASDREADYYGVAGAYVETDTRGAFGRVSTTASGLGSRAGLFDLYYLARPGGGSFDVFLDGQRQDRVATGAPRAAGAYATYRVPDGPHTLEVRARGDGPVRLFAVAVERETPGVIVDTLGINGARARYQQLWDDGLYREHLARRRADLVALAYGTNESGDRRPIASYEASLRSVVRRVREVAPNASCLLIGPSDRPVSRPDGAFEDRPRTADIVAVQHRVAVSEGCAFFDLVAFSGGPLSMVEWAAKDPAYAAPDHVHYTRRGYERLAQVLEAALLEGMDGT
ncbi:MAG: GDSL-type esterase/lipase family protein [Myxococcota bacterium]